MAALADQYMQRIANIQDAYVQFILDARLAQQKRDELIKEFNEFISYVVEITSQDTIAKEVTKMLGVRKRLKEELKDA